MYFRSLFFMTPFIEGDSRLYRFALIFFTGFLFFGALYYARVFLIPVSYAALLSMLMLPVCSKLEKWGLNRGVAIVICILIIILTFAGFIYFFSKQLINFSQDLPELRSKLDEKLSELQLFIQEKADISPERQISYLRSQSTSFFNSAGQYLGNILVATTDTLAKTGLALIYIFFFLFYRDKFEIFALKLVKKERNQKVKLIIKNTSKVTQLYLGGKLIVTLVLAVFLTTGLMIAGLENAVFWGIFAALLNFIPYIGTFLGGFIPFLVALITRDSLTIPLVVALIFMGGQFIENNFLTPLIIGSKVDLNPLFTIMAIIIGGILWGVSGLILFIPFLGIAKIIFDNIKPLHPYAYLISDESKSSKPTFGEKIKAWFKSAKN